MGKIRKICKFAIWKPTFLSKNAGHHMAIVGEPYNADAHAKFPSLFKSILRQHLQNLSIAMCALSMYSRLCLKMSSFLHIHLHDAADIYSMTSNSISRTISGYLWLSLAISDRLGLSLVIPGYIQLSSAISGYLRLSRTIFGLSQVISGYLWLYLAISGYICVSGAI